MALWSASACHLLVIVLLALAGLAAVLHGWFAQ
jgi:hypothetical protein